ncbi:single-stranded DNA-binding protein [Taylorella equigenitalis]|uniref:single-stranded DNA-binding protein n=1 Tax=Taylorella equigenitalis TaxID=29575 RepID=UPI000BACA8A7|nr:single-stranded DNA-binding protein [Taylorella equigenitalis]ASY42867.1 single-stranded DNA-binding protein [Taylorella equigenitalis]RBA26936.1 single-stranded DNA-binding protein [Taylorella equigenitalis]
MANLNKVTLIGHLGRNPEFKVNKNNAKVATLSIATSVVWVDKANSERHERTDWHRVILFGNLAELAEKFLKTGSHVYIEGRLRNRKWEDDDGNDQYITEIYASSMLMLNRPPSQDNGSLESEELEILEEV